MTAGSREFDRYAGDYKALLDRSIQMSGDSGEYFSEYKARYIARAIGSNFSGKLLDFGCGVGLLAARLQRHLPAATIDGYDPSPESIGLVPVPLAAGGHFSDNLGDFDGDYGVAVVSNVMHHVSKHQREQTIVEIASHLAPGGRLILFEHNPWNPLTRWVVRHCAFDDGVALLSPGEVSAYFAQAGLNLRARDFIVFFPKLLSSLRALEPSLRWLPAGAQYAIVGEKHAG